jgi:ABC-2 type transport system ATP-binding protein
MRCEMAAALLHNPPIVFLDEPTIGLDLIAKDRIRQFLKNINRELRTTILLTTHDLSDIEELCRRVIIIDKGKLLYDGSLEELRHRLGRYNLINIHLDDRRHRSKLDQVLGGGNGIRWEHVDELTYRIRFDREQVSSAEIIRKIVNEVPIHDIYIEAEPIEDIIKTIYSRGLLER